MKTLYSIVLLSAFAMATPALAGSWGCSAVSKDGQQFNHNWGNPNKTEAIHDELASCATMGGGKCHILKCSDQVSTREQARKVLPSVFGKNMKYHDTP